jgi:hypothetical protein
MENMQRGWKKEEFSSPDLIWMLDLSGQVVEKNRVVKVSGHAPKLVYLYLVRCLDIDQRVMPSRKTIARFTQLSESTVKRALKVLVNFGLIEIIHRFKDGTKENDTNYYIVYHPKQVQGLKYLKIAQDQDASMPPGESAMTRGGGVTVNQGGVTVNQGGGVTVNQGGVTVNQGGGVTVNQGGVTVNRKDSSSCSNSSSVVKDPLEENFQKINKAWRETFKQEIEKPAFITLVKYADGDIDFLIDIIDKIKKYHKSKKAIDSPFAFVLSCVQKGGYIVEQPSKQSNTVSKLTKLAEQQKMPAVFNMGSEEKKVTDKELEEQQKRIQEALHKMNGGEQIVN